MRGSRRRMARMKETRDLGVDRLRDFSSEIEDNRMFWYDSRIIRM